MLIVREGKDIYIPFTEAIRLSALLESCGIRQTMPCGGAHICGKCRVKALGELSSPSEAEKALLGEQALQAGIRLACEAIVLGDSVTVWTASEAFDESSPSSSREDLSPPCMPDADEDGYGMAVDIGSTTVEAAVYRLSDGLLCFSQSLPNDQRMFGSDVITRIGAASNGCLSDLKNSITCQINELRKASPFPIKREVMVGNTVMLHLLNGTDPSPMGMYPYPVPDRFGRTEGNRYLGKCVSAFVGADAVSAVAACGLSEKDAALLVDLGTNGEIVLSHKGRLLCTATAAGPALEGGGISCGMPAFAGAIRSVSLNGEGKLRMETVQNESAKGLCGSGLLDALACLLRLGIVDKSGYLEQRYPLCVGANGDAITVSPEDIRALQLAKGAIRTGIDLLLRKAALTEADVKHLFLAGRFGSSLNLDSCYAVGLLPFFPHAEIRQIGNAALRGAAGMLLNTSFREKSEDIAAVLEAIDLSESDDFDDCFLKNLPFI